MRARVRFRRPRLPWWKLSMQVPDRGSRFCATSSATA
uniref:Uncharacterized protein n=1 Tax=Anopheles quadriannulatus TaxID=34691 RepID=A0A182XQM9_ANOQN